MRREPPGSVAAAGSSARPAMLCGLRAAWRGPAWRSLARQRSSLQAGPCAAQDAAWQASRSVLALAPPSLATAALSGGGAGGSDDDQATKVPCPHVGGSAAVAAAVAALLAGMVLARGGREASCAEATAGQEVRFTTYNVLAPLLCNESHFPKCAPNTTKESERLPKVLERMKVESASGAVIALQEVDLTWAGKLHAFFAERGYCVVFAQYGSSMSGYMGVMVAWPREKFEALDVEISRIADTAPKGTWPKADREAAPSLSPFGILTYKGLMDVLGCKPPELKPLDDNFEWRTAQNRHNEAIFVRLRARGQPGGKPFCVGTYHMPCLFGPPEKVRVVNIHTYLLLARLKKFAGDDPVVLMGDFNFKPESSPYLLAASGGSLDAAAAASWEELVGLKDRLKGAPLWPGGLKSAYRAFHNREPPFTNFAHTKGSEDPFIDTLDYIWFTEGPLMVVDVPKLPQSQEEVRGPFPNEAEPSDHLPVRATLHLGQPAPAARL